MTLERVAKRTSCDSLCAGLRLRNVWDHGQLDWQPSSHNARYRRGGDCDHRVTDSCWQASQGSYSLNVLAAAVAHVALIQSLLSQRGLFVVSHSQRPLPYTIARCRDRFPHLAKQPIKSSWTVPIQIRALSHSHLHCAFPASTRRPWAWHALDTNKLHHPGILLPVSGRLL
ncbi:uncharacterized protein M421DRAFT_175111 [Didymella exigua CBS 183.55]|uniref:Uncharacterized protein n=1 Tax=Didymella exigua CBS 183.55 TaxID=1150837 RepID=A0A6A5RHG5_9PLEO|nr:uncharacterized protein M421DRAFT_175111 [Didymella exigua CBS 183.55]KAF1927765.1 hypothetical protein M421DRAFT_175111 [Didymella exigua CBS 183.55]